MHQKLSKSPISYALAQIRFTSIESIKKFIPDIQERIRQDFPIFKHIKIHAIELRDDNQPTSSTIQQWHFMDKNSVTGILLDGQSITIHTSEYDNFANLIGKFKKCLQEINSILQVSLFVRSGVRYINVIEDNLEGFIKKELLGFNLQDKFFDGNKYFISNELVQKTKIGLIKVKGALFREIIPTESNMFIPSELSSVANHLTFNRMKPKNKFFMLDIDHFNDVQGDFNIETVTQGLKDLQEGCYLAFREAITEKAFKEWQ